MRVRRKLSNLAQPPGFDLVNEPAHGVPMLYEWTRLSYTAIDTMVESTEQPELRFHPLLTDGVPGVRFEQVMIG